MKNINLLAILCVSLTLGGCVAEEETTHDSNNAPSEELDTVQDEITLTCGATFDCRSYPPPARTDGRTWLFYGSNYCNTNGSVRCKFVPSGLTSSFPTIISHSVPTTCKSCLSNNNKTSTCTNSSIYDISSWSWVCQLVYTSRELSSKKG